MTFYSDLLIVIDELDSLELGLSPKRSVPDLREICTRILAVDPEEGLAEQLLAQLTASAADVEAVPEDAAGWTRPIRRFFRKTRHAFPEPKPVNPSTTKREPIGRASGQSVIFVRSPAKGSAAPDMTLEQAAIYLSADSFWSANHVATVGAVTEEIRLALQHGRLTAWGKLRRAEAAWLRIVPAPWDRKCEIDVSGGSVWFKAHDMLVHEIRLSRAEVENEYPSL